MAKSGAPSGGRVTPMAKRRRLDVDNLSSLLMTPHKVLGRAKGGAPLGESEIMRALCNCVVSAANGEDGVEDRQPPQHSVELLKELLDMQGVDPNCGNQQILRAHGGTPLHLAVSLDAPKCADALLEHGASVVTAFQHAASVVTAFQGVTPLELALQQGRGSWRDKLLDHVFRLEGGRDDEESTQG
ncbi:hypothetical protein JKP88DRAFT_292418 [Tribonema minus]|uniref:Uncharacterized protein n=1 Tax=Tribonema minus TaxID=303371 RepID=A0A835ZIH7_9STRA|nr:hypothetical protein JKP88DRAFT_292418 [Tribonema minus]